MEQGLSGIPEVLGIQGIPSPPSSPPLAALTSANELALMSKTNNRQRDNDGRRKSRREGAAYHIREECERLFCESMKTVFLGEEGMAATNGSYVMGTNAHSPPDERLDTYNPYFSKGETQAVDAWIEVWDYVGGASFRGFVGGNGEKKTLFAFFDSAVVGRDSKQGYVLSQYLPYIILTILGSWHSSNLPRPSSPSPTSSYASIAPS